MGIASQSDLFKADSPAEEKKEWTMHRIFSPKINLSPIAESFTNPLETLLGFVIFILGVAAIIGKPSVTLTVIGVLLLVEVSFERLLKSRVQPVVEAKKPKKQKQVV